LRARWALIVLLLVVAVGLISRRYPIGARLYDKSLGDVLYAMAAYLTLALLRQRWPPALVAEVALAVCLAVELFQLTGIPARHASLPLVRWFLGTQFAWEDIGCYILGVGVIAASDRYRERRLAR
jgi:hypothetical protein